MVKRLSSALRPVSRLLRGLGTPLKTDRCVMFLFKFYTATRPFWTRGCKTVKLLVSLKMKPHAGGRTTSLLLEKPLKTNQSPE